MRILPVHLLFLSPGHIKLVPEKLRTNWVELYQRKSEYQLPQIEHQNERLSNTSTTAEWELIDVRALEKLESNILNLSPHIDVCRDVKRYNTKG